MAKKKRKVKSRATATAQAQSTSAAPNYEAPDFSQEYRYVYYDLRRIGIIAAVMLAILIILSFFIG